MKLFQKLYEGLRMTIDTYLEVKRYNVAPLE